MLHTLRPNHWSPANSARTDIASKIESVAGKLAESGQSAFTHLELLGAATTQRPFPATAVAPFRQMIVDGELIASIDQSGVEYLRSRKVSAFVIDRLTRDSSKRLSETDFLSALTITLPRYEAAA